MVTAGGEITDVVSIAPAQMVTAHMVPDRIGTVSDQMAAGMTTHYEVLP